jgi:hypothetical protein
MVAGLLCPSNQIWRTEDYAIRAVLLLQEEWGKLVARLNRTKGDALVLQPMRQSHYRGRYELSELWSAVSSAATVGRNVCAVAVGRSGGIS